MDTLQCAVVLAKLERFDWEIAQRLAHGARYHRLLAGLEGVGLLEVRDDSSCVWAQYTVFVDERDRVQAHLRSMGVPTAVHYPKPLHHQPAYRQNGQSERFPNSVEAARRVMSLPMSADLLEADQDAVVRHLRDACGQTGA
jgi:UDP-2-acetamido-2-deoxy-ribo-hexuluronate aminotransferase